MVMDKWSEIEKREDQITVHLNALWKLATVGGVGNKTREAMKDHLRRIAILRKAQKADLAELAKEKDEKRD